MKKVLIMMLVISLATAMPLAAVCERESEAARARYDSPYGFSIEYSQRDWIIIEARALLDATEGEAALAAIGAEGAELMSAYANGTEAVFLFMNNGAADESVSIARQPGFTGVSTAQLLALEAGLRAQYESVYGDKVSFPAPAGIVNVGAHEFMRLEALITVDDTSVSAVQLMLAHGDHLYSVTYAITSEDEQARANILDMLKTLTFTDE